METQVGYRHRDMKRKAGNAGGRGCAAPGTVRRMSVAEVAPLQFWIKFVVPRQPVILVGQLPDKEWRASAWTSDYLADKAVRSAVLPAHDLRRRNPWRRTVCSASVGTWCAVL